METEKEETVALGGWHCLFRMVQLDWTILILLGSLVFLQVKTRMYPLCLCWILSLLLLEDLLHICLHSFLSQYLEAH